MVKFTFLGDPLKPNKTPSAGTCLGELPGGFCDVGCCCCFYLTGGFYISGLLFFATGTPLWLLRPVKASTSSELYPGYFRLLYFCQAYSVTALTRALRFWVGICYPQAFLTLRSFIDIFGTFCNSDAVGTPPSRIFLCACPHRVVPAGWRMDLNYLLIL